MCRLHQDLDVPVGLIVGAVGGTPSGYWLSQEAYDADPACKQVVKEFAKTFSIEPAEKSYQQALAKWEKDVAAAKKRETSGCRVGPAPSLKPGECRGKLGHLYEAHIRPFIPYAIRGVLWDQGESGTAIQGVDQYTLMGALIRGWRKDWGQGDFPFIYVQKPSGGGCAWDPADPTTCKAEKFAPLPAAVPGLREGIYRETHIRIMRYPEHGHGHRQRLGARRAPGEQVRLRCPGRPGGVGDCLRPEAGNLRPDLQVAPGRRQQDPPEFHPRGKGPCRSPRRQAARLRRCRQRQGVPLGRRREIDGDTVVVSSPSVSKPVAARYAWANKHPWANLFNKDGLPAITFRTDSW